MPSVMDIVDVAAVALKQVFGTANDRLLRDIVPTVERINDLEPAMQDMTDAELRGMTPKFRERLVGKSYDEERRILLEILPEAFAVAREASRRVLVTPNPDTKNPTMRHFDVQLIGGVALHTGMIAEMATGEGKTLVATLAAYLNALSGHGVHIVTVNDYLARRDRDWMAPLYEYLGMTAGAIQAHQGAEEKRAAYACDITFGTNSEFGFDYLRDNMRVRLDDQVQLKRGLNYAIIDEVDNILIDEARTPLIISGSAMEHTEKFYLADRISRRLKPGEDFEIKEKENQCFLTDKGTEIVEASLRVGSLYDEKNMDWPHFIETSLRAHHLFQKDKDYIVQEGDVVIVDEFTGRLMQGRVWSDGLHQAVAAKERLKIREETQTLATITLQNFFRLYKKLAGMTGTASTEAAEFQKIYGLDVLIIPTNVPLKRINHPDLVYRTVKEKDKAVIDEVVEVHEEGRPILLGTTSIENSEKVSEMLRRRGIEHEVLNAKEHAREALIIAKAGESGNVTIATNMAGRGTDIVLGQGVAEMGGLHVVGTERHEARRIDNQLRGRAGRQGDPGSSRFYVSLEDDLMRVFAPERVSNLLKRFGMEEGVALESRIVSRNIQTAQKRVEEHNFDMRKHLLEYDEVMDEQRKAIYSWRQRLLEGTDVRAEIVQLIEESVLEGADMYLAPDERGAPPDAAGLQEWFKRKYCAPTNLTDAQLEDPEQAEELLIKRALEIYAAKEAELGADELRSFEHYLLLDRLDTKWKDHLHSMDVLRSHIGLRGYAQVDPRNEYKREALEMFENMRASIVGEITDIIFRIQIEKGVEREVKEVFQPVELSHPEVSPTQEQNLKAIEGMQSEKKIEPIRVGTKTGRNDPCPCGSGKKYKHCCGRT
ncbi:MAG TPA: preprotein translocase subunit SecA [Candidatus Brocadiia bacterium]|nr:preprotein translocase subunit SecA [Candidatus Brocadiia bacterium]